VSKERTDEGDEEAREPVPGYVLLAESWGAPLRVSINEWPVIELAGAARTQSTLINPFVVEGKNVLRAEVGPGRPDPESHLHVTLLKHDPRRPPEPKLVLFQAAWTPRHGFWSEDGWEDVARHEFHVTRAFGRWRWESARLFQLQDEAVLRARVLELRSLLERRDVLGFLDACTIKLEELARATGRTLEEARLPQQEILKIALAQPDLIIPAWEPDDLAFRSGAGGRLVRATLKDGRAPLCLVVEDDPMELPIVLSAIDGRFEVVR
jgi:hypothetical protein